MPTFQKCDQSVRDMANEILCAFETHQPLLDARLTFDFVFAHADLDDKTGEPTGNALSKNGCKALGIAKTIALKERALGRADVEVALDGDWWRDASHAEQRGLLDHELHHFAVKIDKRGLVRDDLGRPKIQMRKHDYEFGWFKVVAARHGRSSMERQQAGEIMCDAGQYFWPDISSNPLSTPEKLMNALDAAIGDKDADVLDEDLIQNCIEVIRSEQKASVSLLQRRLRLGYTRAARIMDELEKRGIVDPSKGAEPREILIEAK